MEDAWTSIKVELELLLEFHRQQRKIFESGKGWRSMQLHLVETGQVWMLEYVMQRFNQIAPEAVHPAHEETRGHQVMA
ncbi:hypothetical protein LLE49_25860 [Alicyclobacillus tolerans]|uniref:hypothetical protein n=1 Tax=Alicyclobacillus tolerans TaxID=90970 RepID=UPI001F20FEAD|nr:hypothetical protein [Alicyclobacillus tolerans]MCF8568155.1 hypothetical protein [Alicyclobacillus tolerans]